MPTLSPGIVFGGNATIGVAQSLAIRGRDGVPQVELGTDGLANAILTPNGGRAGVGAGAVLTAVPRRLTPRECERLQAFPDDWTRWKADGLELADGPRYRMMGNAVTVAVAEWIGRRIVVHMDGAAG
jgi:DNA (cytosine-5)-methyltransferase 1